MLICVLITVHSRWRIYSDSDAPVDKQAPLAEL